MVRVVGQLYEAGERSVHQSTVDILAEGESLEEGFLGAERKGGRFV
jgi:hypothetical protein